MSRVLVVVAHPDDEALWAGGYLIDHPGTHVLCCSIPKRDPERCIHFFESCRILGARGMFAGSLASQGGIDMDAAKMIAMYYDSIITHNAAGEYGHRGHVGVHNAMRDLTARSGQNMRVFGYGLTTDGAAIDYERKKAAIAVYTSRPKVFENQSRNFDLTKEAFL